MILESPNRGHSAILRIVDGGDWNAERDAGDAWLLRKGFTFVSLGWQWDAADGFKLYAPIAKENGKTITGLLRGDLMLSKTMDEIPLGHFTDGRIGGVEYPVANPDDPRNVLTVRDWREAPRTTIPRDQWQFAHTVDGKLQPSNRHIHLNGGFQAGKLYEYVYVVADPVVAGGAFAMFRDFASYAKHDPKAITPAQRVYGEGISQNGRFLRDLAVSRLQRRRRGPHRARRNPRARRRSGPRQLQLSLRAAVARCAADFIRLLPDRHLPFHRSA